MHTYSIQLKKVIQKKKNGHEMVSITVPKKREKKINNIFMTSIYVKDFLIRY